MAIAYVNKKDFDGFVEKMEKAKRDFVPMLPFVKTEANAWNLEVYRLQDEKSLHLIDELDDDYCLYHSRMDQKAGTPQVLGFTTIIPSSWERRVEIMERSIPNLLQWISDKENYRGVGLPILEHGEYQVWPTLSAYLIPILIRNGFDMTYWMYMRRRHDEPLKYDIALPDGYTLCKYGDDLLDEVCDFYYGREFQNYLVNASEEELREIARKNEDDVFKRTALFVRDEDGAIVAGLFAEPDDGQCVYEGKVWMDNFAVAPSCEDVGLDRYLLQEQLRVLLSLHPKEDIIAYVRRNCGKAVEAYESLGFVGFEYWVDTCWRED